MHKNRGGVKPKDGLQILLPIDIMLFRIQKNIYKHRFMPIRFTLPTKYYRFDDNTRKYCTKGTFVVYIVTA